jgi:hypothetical protein
MALYKDKADPFSLQVRNVVVGALALGMGLGYNACFSYVFVLHDRTGSLAVMQQFGLLVLGALLFTLFLFALLTYWSPDYSISWQF